MSGSIPPYYENLGDEDFRGNRLIANGNWQAAQTGGGNHVTRISIKGIPEAEVTELERVLRQNGFNPIRHPSASLGPTIRLSGDEVERFEGMRGQLSRTHNVGVQSPQLRQNNAIDQSRQFNSQHRIGENERITYGYRDGGRGLRWGADGQPLNRASREIIVVMSPGEDPVLRRAIDDARSAMENMASVEEKAAFLNRYVANLMSQNDPATNERLIESIARRSGHQGMEGAQISLGQLIQSNTGVCRHRSLLFKVLADETGVSTSLVRGNFIGPTASGGHAWNEVVTEDGRRLLVDVMHDFVGDMNDPYVRQYADVNNNYMYRQSVNVRPVASAPQVAPRAQSFEDFLAQKNAAGQVESVPTNKGEGLIFRGSTEELQRMEREFASRGISTQRHGAGSSVGEGLRIRSESVDQVRNMLNGQSADVRRPAAPTPQAAPRAQSSDDVLRGALQQEGVTIGRNMGFGNTTISFTDNSDVSLKEIKDALDKAGIEYSESHKGGAYNKAGDYYEPTKTKITLDNAGSKQVRSLLSESSGRVAKAVRKSGHLSSDLTFGLGSLLINLDETKSIPDLVKGIKNLKIAGKSLKMSTKATIIGGVAATGAVHALLDYVHDTQRDLAGRLLGEGKLTQEAYDEYIELNKDIETMMKAENAAGQGWLFLATTPAVELQAMEMFDKFSKKYNLSQDIHEGLGMSLFDGKSVHAQFAQEAEDAIPKNKNDLSPGLHALWDAKQELDAARKVYKGLQSFSVYKGLNAHVMTAQTSYNQKETRELDDKKEAAFKRLQAAESDYQQEFAEVFSNPTLGREILDKISPDTLMKLTAATAQYNSYEGMDPNIAKIAELAERSENSVNPYEKDAIRRAGFPYYSELRGNPEIVYSYMLRVFGGVNPDIENPSMTYVGEETIENVAFLQYSMELLGYKTGEVDGLRGNVTRPAIESFLSDRSNEDLSPTSDVRDLLRNIDSELKDDSGAFKPEIHNKILNDVNGLIEKGQANGWDTLTSEEAFKLQIGLRAFGVYQVESGGLPHQIPVNGEIDAVTLVGVDDFKKQNIQLKIEPELEVEENSFVTHKDKITETRNILMEFSKTKNITPEQQEILKQNLGLFVETGIINLEMENTDLGDPEAFQAACVEFMNTYCPDMEADDLAPTTIKSFEEIAYDIVHTHSQIIPLYTDLSSQPTLDTFKVK